MLCWCAWILVFCSDKFGPFSENRNVLEKMETELVDVLLGRASFAATLSSLAWTTRQHFWLIPIRQSTLSHD